jgi:hypothetical protein
VEGMTTMEASDIIFILDSIDANGASVARIWKLFGRDGGLDMIIIVIGFIVGGNLFDW